MWQQHLKVEIRKKQTNKRIRSTESKSEGTQILKVVFI